MGRAPNVSFSIEEAGGRYCVLMQEIATRIGLVEAAYGGQLTLTPPFWHEYCYFQFRRICELLALACVTVHGNVEGARTQKMIKSYSADAIMKRLGELHPRSFPTPAKVAQGDGGIKLDAGHQFVAGALTMDEFLSLSRKCGEVLHRGTIKSIEAEGALPAEAFEEVRQWHDKLILLLDTHVIAEAGGKQFCLVHLATVEGGPLFIVCTPEPQTGGMSMHKIRLSRLPRV
jgi:hypothetical protein